MEGLLLAVHLYLLHIHFRLFLGLLFLLGVSLRLNPRYLFKFLDGHGHEYSEHMHGSSLELFCSFVDLESVLFNSICDLILLVIFLLLAVMGVLLFESLHDTLFLEIAAG